MFPFATRRHVALAVTIFALTLIGFFLARALTAAGSRSESRHEANLVAVQISDSVERAGGYVDSLRQVFGGRGVVTQGRFSAFADAALGPVGLVHAAWVERVPAAGRAGYERALGRPITQRTAHGRVRPAPPRAVYYPATLTAVHTPPAALGLDWGAAAALRRVLGGSSPLFGVVSTPPVQGPGGERGLYFTESAPRPAAAGGERQGWVVVFVPAQWLLASPTAPGIQRVAVMVGGATIGAAGIGSDVVRRSFTAAGRRWTVMQPVVAARGADALLPWLILGAGAVVAVLAGWLGENRTRRARAQGELDRIFNLSSDLIAVVDFEGRFTRVNPAVEHILGYTQEELVARPYLDFVHPDDRRKTAAQATAIARGKTMSAFENRFLRKDGSERVLEWTATPVAERGVMYGVGRDVTDRRFTDAELDRLADEQAALRRVATRIAREASQADVFAQIADEIRRLLGAEEIRMFRYDEEPSAVVVGAAGSQGVFPLGSRESLDGDTCTSRVFRTGQTARIDDYGKARGSMADAARALGVLSAVGAPILVDGRVWGAIVAGWIHGEPPPPDTEWRLGQFTELMATAISNTESRSEVQRLADEQAALRRVATLVAEGASPPDVFDAVAAEMERLLDPDQVALCRYEPGAEVTIVAYRGNGAEIIPPGTRASHKDGDSATAAVWRTQRPARIDHVDAGGDGIPALARMLGARTSVGTPVVMDGRLWGVITASWTSEEAPRGDTEERMAHFAQLLETAIANADSHVQLDASRARLLSEADEARRRLVRDLHDGAQQRLVQTILTLKLARQALGARERETQALIAEALAQADRGNVELRELAHGILPPVLTRGGLRAGVDALVTRLDLRVDVDIPADRFPGEIEASAYFIVAEGLTNVVKHAHAEHAEVSASVEDGLLRVDVRDDGSGGADPDGHGLIGLRDRVTALGGGLTVESPSSGGTWLRATLPVDAT